MHLSSGPNSKKKYDWGEESLDEAFNRIMCSTTDEFEKQVQMSDGRGAWYDPQLKKRVYKTLPISVARAL
jgi:hypothetical protein